MQSKYEAPSQARQRQAFRDMKSQIYHQLQLEIQHECEAQILQMQQSVEVEQEQLQLQIDTVFVALSAQLECCKW
jgi:hypothetical protein